MSHLHQYLCIAAKPTVMLYNNAVRVSPKLLRMLWNIWSTRSWYWCDWGFSVLSRITSIMECLNSRVRINVLLTRRSFLPEGEREDWPKLCALEKCRGWPSKGHVKITLIACVWVHHVNDITSRHFGLLRHRVFLVMKTKLVRHIRIKIMYALLIKLLPDSEDGFKWTVTRKTWQCEDCVEHSVSK